MPNRAIMTRCTWLAVVGFIVLNVPAFGQHVEPNDTTRQANEITLPHFDLLGDIGTPQDVDFYKFSASQGREITVWIRTSSMGSELTARVGFHDGAGKLLAYNDRQWNLWTNGPGEEPILYLKAPRTGTFYLSVSADSDPLNPQFSGRNATGKYRLYVGSGFDNPAVPDRSEPNDSTSAASAIPVPFQQNANLLYFGDVDWYKFTATRAQKIVVDVDALEKAAGFAGFAVKTRIGVFDRFGNLIVENDGAADPDTGFNGDPALLFQAPYDGTFYAAVTIAWDTQYSSGYNYTEFLKDPYVSSERHDIGYYRLNLHALNELVFPQIANGSFGEVHFTTSLLLVNYSPEIATGKIDFLKADGTPMLSTFEPGAPQASSYWFSISPKGSWVVRTDGEGPGASGYAVLQSSVPVGASAVFSQHEYDGTLVTEAGVVAAGAMEFFTFPVDVTGAFNTGVAVANTNQDRRASLYLKLLDPNGQPVQTRNIALEAGHQVSIFVSGAGQLFPNVTNFRGSLQVYADAPVHAVALRSTARTLSTLPTAGLNQAQTPVTLYFPHVVNGRSGVSYRSTIILTNPGYFGVSGTLNFKRADGSPMPVGSSGQALIPFDLKPQGTGFIELPASSEPLQRGYAILTADHTVAGVIIFSQYDRVTGSLQTEVAVGAAEPYRKFCLFAEQEGTHNTGIAVANMNPVAADLRYRLDRASGASIERGPVALSPGQQTAELIAGTAQIFPEFSGTGNLEVDSSEPVPAVALRITNTSMTALPVVPVP